MFISFVQSQDLTKEQQQWLLWEHTSNSFHQTKTRPPQIYEHNQDERIISINPITIEHFLIPLELLAFHYDFKTHPSLSASLIVKDELTGKKMVRWPINPEDNLYHQKLEKHLKDLGVSVERHRYYQGYLTSSRSMVLVDPHNGTSFSLKVSTNKTGGEFQFKKLDEDQIYGPYMASKIAQASQHFSEQLPSELSVQRFVHLLIQKEPLGFVLHLGGSDTQGLSVRELETFEKQHYYLPGFSAVHSETGKMIVQRILKKDGVSDQEISDFWRIHFADPLGRSMAEFLSRTGISYSSAHGQNFLIELDHDYRPTGRIVFRDFGDQMLLSGFHYPVESVPWMRPFRKIADLEINFGLLRVHPPTWMNIRRYEEWKRTFYQAFEERFSEMSGVDLLQLGYSYFRLKGDMSGDYASRHYTVNRSDNEWKRFFSLSACFTSQELTLEERSSCLEVIRSWPKQKRPEVFHCDLSAQKAIDYHPFQQVMITLDQSRSNLKRQRARILKKPVESVLDYSPVDVFSTRRSLINKKNICHDQSLNMLSGQMRDLLREIRGLEIIWGDRHIDEDDEHLWVPYSDGPLQQLVEKELIQMKSELINLQNHLEDNPQLIQQTQQNEMKLAQWGKMKKWFCAKKYQTKKKSIEDVQQNVTQRIQHYGDLYQQFEQRLMLKTLMKEGTHAQKWLAVSLLKCVDKP